MRFDPRILRTAVIWIAIFVAVFGASLAALLESGVLTPTIVEAIDERLAPSGLRFEAESLYWRPWSGLNVSHVALWSRDVSNGASAPDSSGPSGGELLVSVDRLEVHYRALNLLSARPHVDHIKVIRPNVDVEAFGRWNAASSASDAGDRAGIGPRGGAPIRVEDFRLLDGRLTAPAGVEISGLRLVGRLQGDPDGWRLWIETGGARLRTPSIDEQVEFTGDIGLSGGSMHLSGLHFSAAGGRVSFDGHLGVRDGNEGIVQIDGFAVPLDKVGEWIGVTHPLLLSNLEFSLIAAGRADSLRLSGELHGTGSDGIRRDVHFSGTRTPSALKMETFHFVAGASHVDLQGEMTLGDEPHLRGVAVFRDLDPGVVLADTTLAVVNGIDGALRFDGFGFTRDDFRGTAQLELTRGTIFDYSFDRGSARITLDRGELTLEGATIVRGLSEVSGVGSITRDNQVAAEFSGTIVDLEDLGNVTFGGASLSGAASVEVRVLGPLQGPELEATLRFQDASVLGLGVRELEVVLKSDRLGSDGEISVRVDAIDLGIGDRTIPRGQASGVLRASGVDVHRLELTSENLGRLFLTGDLEVAPGGSLSGRITTLQISAPGGASKWSNAGPILIEQTPERVTIVGVELRGDHGVITGDVSVEADGQSFIRAVGSDVDLSVFTPYLLLSKPLGGNLDFRVDGSFGSGGIAGDFAIDLHDGRWGDDTLDRVEGNVVLTDSTGAFDNVHLLSSFATATLDGRVYLPGGSFARVVADSAARAGLLDRMEFDNLQLHLESPDFDWFWDLVPQVPRFAGAGSFTARIDGPLLNPVVEIRADLSDGQLGSRPLDRFSVSGTYEGLDLTVREGLLRSGQGVLEFEGNVPFRWNFQQPIPDFPIGREANLVMRAVEFPVGSLSSLIPLFEVIDGTAEADISWKGVSGDMYFEGDFEITDATVRIPTFENPLVNGKVAGTFDHDGIRLTQGSFEDGAGGIVTGVGTVAMHNVGVTDFRLDIVARQYHYAGELNGIRAVASGQIAMTGFTDSDGSVVPKFEGGLQVSRADIDERALVPPEARTGQMPEGVNAPDEEAPDAPEAAAAPPRIYAEISLSANRDIWLRTPEMELEAAGDVVLHITPQYAGLTGNGRTLRGTYSVLNSRFNVERARVEFVNPQEPLANYLDAEATTRVLDEDVTVLVTGTFAEPIIELSTDSNMSEAEIYELLALRIKRDDDPDTPQGALGTAFRDSYLAAFTNRFGGSLSREFGLDTFDFETGGTDTGDPTVTVGKRVGRDFFLKYRQSIQALGDADSNPTRESLESPERALALEYRLSEIFILQGETGTLKIGDDYLNVDLKVEWGY